MFTIENLKAWAAQAMRRLRLVWRTLSPCAVDATRTFTRTLHGPYTNGYLVHSWDNPEEIRIVSNLGVLKINSDGTSEMEACELF